MRRTYVVVFCMMLALVFSACTSKKPETPETTTGRTESTTEKASEKAPETTETTTETTTEESTTAEAKPQDVLNFVGEYSDLADQPALEIDKTADGKYVVQLSIEGLASLDDGAGELTKDGLAFVATDPAGNPIHALVTLEDTKALVTFTESSWNLIQSGSVFEYVKTSDTPHMWSPVDDTDDAAWIGEYVDEEKTPSLEIRKRDDGKYDVQISITGLCVLDDGLGELNGEEMAFAATDPAENTIKGTIVLTDQGAKVTFTESEWTYLENGTSFEYEKTSDVPGTFQG
ncbi:MAG: hypothetical protein IJU99_00965 [Lachnospiraceae bacterium]|nr:hypothetical protein [Lachnospiraceae bacterium]